MKDPADGTPRKHQGSKGIRCTATLQGSIGWFPETNGSEVEYYKCMNQLFLTNYIDVTSGFNVVEPVSILQGTSTTVVPQLLWDLTPEWKMWSHFFSEYAVRSMKIELTPPTRLSAEAGDVVAGPTPLGGIPGENTELVSNPYIGMYVQTRTIPKWHYRYEPVSAGFGLDMQSFNELPFARTWRHFHHPNGNPRPLTLKLRDNFPNHWTYTGYWGGTATSPTRTYQPILFYSGVYNSGGLSGTTWPYVTPQPGMIGIVIDTGNALNGPLTWFGGPPLAEPQPVSNGTPPPIFNFTISWEMEFRTPVPKKFVSVTYAYEVASHHRRRQEEALAKLPPGITLDLADVPDPRSDLEELLRHLGKSLEEMPDVDALELSDYESVPRTPSASDAPASAPHPRAAPTRPSSAARLAANGPDPRRRRVA